MNWPTPRTSLAIARVEYRRTLRAMGGSTMQMLRFGILGLVFIGGLTVGGGYVAYTFGEQILDSVPVLSGVRGGLALVWLFGTFMALSRTFGKTGRIDHEAGLLTTVPAADVLGGLVGAEAAHFLSVIGLPIIVIVAALAVGIGAPIAFVTIVVALLGVLTTALLVGHIVGVLIKVAFGESELLTRYKSVIAVVAFLAYFAVVFTGGINRILARLFVLLQSAPIAWFGDLLVAGIPGVSPSPVRIAGAVGVLVVGVPVLVALDVRAATRLWYADTAQPEARTHGSSAESNAEFLARIASGPTRTVTAKIWRRTKRAPLRIAFVVYPLIFLVSPIQQAATTGRVPVSLPILVALAGRGLSARRRSTRLATRARCCR